MLYDEVIKIAEHEFGVNIDNVFIEEARIGVFLTAIRLSTGSYGLAYTDSHNCQCFNREERNYGVFSPNQIQGRTLKELFIDSSSDFFKATLKAAAINGLSKYMIDKKELNIKSNTDVIDLINLCDKKDVTVVGGFKSYIRRISDTSCRLKVLELDEDVIPPEHKKYFVPAERAADTIPDSDVVLITGSSLVNNTLEDLLKLTNPRATVAVVGPSSGIYPEVLFKRNVDLVGTTRIIDPASVMQVVSEGGAGYHLFRNGAEKITIIRDDYETGA